ncbi:hypothetical protein [Cupriavidus sp. D39]|nr:hypothetical protein [Cupriavidus sp. D39]MCY0854900.1 hypothetical protein [Cupriavidus sp. D39]
MDHIFTWWEWRKAAPGRIGRRQKETGNILDRFRPVDGNRTIPLFLAI